MNCEKYKLKFAFWPTKIQSTIYGEKTVWLSFYYVYKNVKLDAATLHETMAEDLSRDWLAM